MKEYVTEVLFSHEEIVARCEVLGKQITKDYEGKKLMVIGLLKGSVPFLAELIKHIDCDVELEFMQASSYKGTTSSQAVVITKDITTPVVDRNLLIVEDIVDTGFTLREIMKVLRHRGAESIAVCTLLNKQEGRLIEGIEPKYIGFEIENKFVIGFGLDYNQKYRNLDFVGVFNLDYLDK